MYTLYVAGVHFYIKGHRYDLLLCAAAVSGEAKHKLNEQTSSSKSVLVRQSV